VLREDGREHFELAVNGRSFSKIRKIVTGGSTRAASVKNGLNAVDPACHTVAVHDAARPLVSIDEITRTIETAVVVGAACLVAEVTDTIKEVSEGLIRGTTDRSKLRRALTPQAFRTDILRRAFEDVELNDAVTDECYLVEKLGVDITIVEGRARNIKISREDDLRIAEAYLRIETG
jgi:2-C-methyl-D-erythritol 4-phosphate cytidylyltransferase